MENKGLAKITHKNFITALLVFGVLYVIDAFISFIYLIRLGSAVREFGSFGNLFGADLSSVLNLAIVDGPVVFLLAVIFVAFLVVIVAYMVKMARENTYKCVFVNASLFLATVVAFLAFNINFVIRPTARVLGMLVALLLLLVSGFLVFVTVMVLKNNYMIKIDDLKKFNFGTVSNVPTDVKRAEVENVVVADETVAETVENNEAPTNEE